MLSHIHGLFLEVQITRYRGCRNAVLRALQNCLYLFIVRKKIGARNGHFEVMRCHFLHDLSSAMLLSVQGSETIDTTRRIKGDTGFFDTPQRGIWSTRMVDTLQHVLRYVHASRVDEREGRCIRR